MAAIINNGGVFDANGGLSRLQVCDYRERIPVTVKGNSTTNAPAKMRQCCICG